MSADEFIEEFQHRFNQLAICNFVQVNPSSGNGSTISLDYIRVEQTKRKNGLATRVLTLLLELSDETGVAIEVVPHSFEPEVMSDDELAAWYARYGFVSAPTEEQPKRMMYREKRGAKS